MLLHRDKVVICLQPLLGLVEAEVRFVVDEPLSILLMDDERAPLAAENLRQELVDHQSVDLPKKEN